MLRTLAVADAITDVDNSSEDMKSIVLWKTEGVGVAQDSVVEDIYKAPAVLLVDDDPMICDSLAFVLKERFDVRVCNSRAQAMDTLRALGARVSLALVDLGLPPSPHESGEGFTLVDELLRFNPQMKVVVLSGQNDRANIQHALTLGAANFVAKPCDPQILLARLEHQQAMLEAEQATRLAQLRCDELIGTSAAMNTLREEVQRFASTPFPVLVQGESGTGKELVARALHDGGNRVKTPFVCVNCAAFTLELLDAQLFGHARGAFTGANSARSGFFEEAGEGTLFLDEIGDFPLELQPKLLRVLEDGEYYRVGETRTRRATARIVAATNRDLLEEIRRGNFRHDLYHRLGVLTIQVPPLRSRNGDSFALLEHYRGFYAAKMKPFTLSGEAERRWAQYAFPGNVRELRNIVIRLGAKYPGQTISLTALEAELDSRSQLDAGTIERLKAGEFQLDAVLSHWEQRYIESALELSGGNLSEAARLLGVNRTTLYSKIQRLSAGV